MGSEGAIHGKSSRNVLRHGSIVDVPRVCSGTVWGAQGLPRGCVGAPHATGIRLPGSEHSPAVQTLRRACAAPPGKVKPGASPALQAPPSSLSLCAHVGTSCLRPCWDRSLPRVLEVVFASSLSDDMEGGGIYTI